MGLWNPISSEKIAAISTVQIFQRYTFFARSRQATGKTSTLNPARKKP
jgi:hypothetical protein